MKRFTSTSCSAQRLRQAREQLGLSQAAFGEPLGYSQSQISRIESERCAVPFHHLTLAAHHFGLSIRWLAESHPCWQRLSQPATS